MNYLSEFNVKRISKFICLKILNLFHLCFKAIKFIILNFKYRSFVNQDHFTTYCFCYLIH